MKEKNLMENQIRKIILTQEQIREKIIELSDRISRDYFDKDLIIISLLKGSVLFLSDLIRRLDMQLAYDFIAVQSYFDSTESSGRVEITKELTLDIRGREVLLLDDILDSGRTLEHILKYIEKFSPRSVKTCVLLDKAARRETGIRPDYSGFSIDDYFVVGYGHDYRDMYRNLPYIAVLKPVEQTSDN